MRQTVTTWMGAVLFAGALAGCGGSSGSGGAASTASAPSIASATTASDTSAGGASTAPYSDAEACAWLKENLPKWAGITSDVGVQAQLTIGLASFFEDHGGLQNADGYAYDDATVRGCRAEHDQAIKLAGIKSFGNL